MNSITIDSKKFLDDLTMILSRLVISTESRNIAQNKIISALINAKLSKGDSEFNRYTEFDNDDPDDKDASPSGYFEFLNGFKQSIIDSNIALEKTRFENAIKIAVFSDAVGKKVVFRAVITEYKYALVQLQIDGILS